MSMRIASVIFLLFISSCGSFYAPPENAGLVGCWTFVADQQLDSGNTVTRQDTLVSGLLVYTPEGQMSVQLLWRGTRGSLLADSIMAQDGQSAGLGLGSNTWTPEQARTLIDTYDAYFGTYQVDWQHHGVIHTLTGNLRPEKRGMAYQRLFRLKADSLFLRSADPALKWQAAFVKNRSLSHPGASE